jgi:glycosyltransferase involved in cell wall biosynthesis
VIRVGFVLTLDATGWLGGVSYFRNLLNALYALPDRSLEAVIFTGVRTRAEDFKDLPDVTVVRSRLFDRGTLPWMKRKLWTRIFSHDWFLERLLNSHRIAVLSHSSWLGEGASIPTIGWIPDFQHVYLPGCFNPAEIRLRNREYHQICRLCSAVIVSSYAAQSDLLQFEPGCRSKSHVLQFVARSVDDKMAQSSSLELADKYRYSGRYFLLPNQFWKHKNHGVVLEALGLLVGEEKHVLVIATGNAADYRHPSYFESLMRRIQELGVEENFRYIGLVPSSDLAGLMSGAVAVINPSNFEGWSTSVEEAKSLGQRVIVSDIPVHREQNPHYANYFPPDDAKKLADILWSVWNEPIPDAKDRMADASRAIDQRRIEFGRRYQDIVLSLARNHS